MSEVNTLHNSCLGEIIDIRDGTHNSPQYIKHGIPLITSKNLTDAGLCFRNVNFISEDNHKEISKRSGVDRGDILYGMIGTIGKPTLVDTDRKFSIKNVALFKQSNPLIYNRYLRWLLSSSSINKQIAHASKGGTQKFVSLGALRGLEATFPPLPEQRRIAAILDQADALRAKRREALAQLDSLTQSIFIEMFGDKNVPKRSIGQLLDDRVLLLHKDGNHGSLYPQADDFGDSGIPFLSAKCVTKEGLIDDAQIERLREEKATKLKIGWIQQGDVLLAHNASVGKVALYDGRFSKALIGTSLTGFRPNPDLLSSQFLAASLRSPAFQRQLEKNMGQTTRNQVPITAQRDLNLSIPPIDSQIEFSKKLSVVKKQSELNHAASIELSTLFASLQHRAFRGEL